MSDADQQARQRWMGILAKADSQHLQSLWHSLAVKQDYTFIRKPETGLTMVRGRTGGSGQPFNMGEMTLTRCALRLTTDKNQVGVSYIAGRNHDHAVTAAMADALLQGNEWHDRLQQELIKPLLQKQQQAEVERSSKAASTKVDFFTLVRGED